MERPKMDPRKTALLAVLLVFVALATSVAVARAATPPITDTTQPPAGHFAGACSGCHLVTPTVPVVPGDGVETPDDSDDASEALDVDDDALGSDDADEALEVEEPDDQDSDDEALSPDHESDADDADDADEAEDADEADEHETVTPNVHERTQHEDERSATQAPHARSPRQGDAGEQDGHHQAGGGSD